MVETGKRIAPARQVYVALLRGINMAGKNRLRMQDLASIFEAAGCRNVRTYIQSGNVVYEAGHLQAHRVSGRVTDLIATKFGYRIPVIVRTALEIRHVAANNPFLNRGADERRLCVMFLEAVPLEANVDRLDPHRSPPDEYAVRGREIYMRCPEGFARTKYTNAYFDSVLGTTSTGRSWATVLKLVELSSSG
jgi:uncharacterized protein (DUF1697 family)